MKKIICNQMKKVASLFLTIVMMLSIIPIGVFDITANIAEYTITYHLDGGTNALKNPDVYTSEDVITLRDATKEGYNFAGWFLDANKTEQISEISGRTGNLNLYAKFTPKTYTATFIDNGATSSDILTLKLDDVSIPINKQTKINPYYHIPQKEGYVFLGWYDGEQLINSSLEINSDLVLKSKWKICSRTKYILGDNAKGVRVTPDSIVESLDGQYTYAGGTEVYFYVSAEYTKIFYSGTGSVKTWSNGSSKGGFQIYDVTNNKYLASVYPDRSTPNGTVSKSGSIEVQPGTLLRISSDSSNSGSDAYSCWGTGNVFAGDIRSADITASDKRFEDVEFNSYITSPNISKIGYNFMGWYDTNGNKMTDIWQYTQDQTFTAKWQPIKYNIMYSLDGGTNSLSNPSSYTIEDSITLNDPYKAGYTFMGWYSSSDFKTKVTNISNQTGNVTLYAKWEVNSYNLTLDANMGTFAPNVTFISDGVEIKKCYLYEQDTLTTYRPENKNGYIFAGWYKDASFTELFTFNGTITEDTTLYAKWIKCSDNVINIENTNSFDVSINGKTEQLYAFVPLVDGKIVVTSLSDGLDLYGILYDNSKNELISSDDIDSDRDLDFSYTYNIKAGQLYYLAVMGNTASTRGEATINIDWTGSCTITGTTYPNRQISVVYDTEYKLPPKPIREGFIFMGWFDENGVQVTDGIWNFTTDKTLTARWDSVENHNHTYGAWMSYDSNQHVRKCMCGEIEYSDHTFGGVCEKYDNNQHVRECVCGEKQYAAHVWDNGVVTTQPTYADEGIMTYTCTDCGATKTSSISSLAPTDMEFTLNDAGTEYSVTAYTGKETEITIPSTYNGLPVTSISDGAFLKSRGLVRIKIPASVKDICVDAFNVCYRLSSIEVNESNPCYKSIDGNLYSKDGKTLIRYASGKSQNIFAMPESVTVVKDNAFYDAYSLETIVFSDNVTAIGLGTMPSTPNLRYIYIGRSVADIAEGAFSSCYGLNEISVNKDNAYYQSIDGKLYSKDGKTLVAFADKAGYGAYSFIVPDGVTRISAKAFGSNYGITDITIPESMTSIGDYAFYFCTDLTSITFKGTFEQWNAITFASTWDEATGDYKVYCTDGVMCKTHTWDSGVVTTQPTCTKEGVKTYTCSVCKTTKTESVAATGVHTEGDWTVTESATCTKTGTKIKKCTVCGATLKTESIAVLDHSWDSGVVTTQPTCTKEGVKTYTCSACKTTKTESVAATGVHTEGDWTVTESATCTKTGTKIKTCTVCGATLKTESIAVLDHSWDSGVVTTQPTCTKEGVKTYTCSACKTTKTEAIAKLIPDINIDSDVDNADAEILLKYITGWDVEINEAIADVNGDGEVNIRDAATILLYLSGKNVELT